MVKSLLSTEQPSHEFPHEMGFSSSPLSTIRFFLNVLALCHLSLALARFVLFLHHIVTCQPGYKFLQYFIYFKFGSGGDWPTSGKITRFLWLLIVSIFPAVASKAVLYGRFDFPPQNTCTNTRPSLSLKQCLSHCEFKVAPQ